jgi:hypothetical protein
MTPRDVERLAKVCGMLASDKDGERAAAALLATQILQSFGVGWVDLVRRGIGLLPPASESRYYAYAQAAQSPGQQRGQQQFREMFGWAAQPTKTNSRHGAKAHQWVDTLLDHHVRRLTAWEVAFLKSLRGNRTYTREGLTLSNKQWWLLEVMAERLGLFDQVA